MPGWTWGDYLHYAIDAALLLVIFLLLGSGAKSETFSTGKNRGAVNLEMKVIR